jgi:hypothetical protein
MPQVARLFFLLSFCIASLILANEAAAESLRCNGEIVFIGDSKADVTIKCGSPSMTDRFCEKVPVRIFKVDGTETWGETCEDVDVWTYNPGKGQFWTHLYFSHGKLREMKYGDRVE